MTDIPQKIFHPGAGIDIVFNLNSLAPLVRSSMIYDATPATRELIVAQTTPRILPHTPFEELHITTLVTGEKREKKRYGLRCSIQGFQKNYPLSGNHFAEVVLFRHEGPITEVNIRSAFRMSPNKKFSIFAKILWETKEYIYGKDFSILDISITGVGLLVPQRIESQRNPLLDMEAGAPLTLGMALKYPQGETSAMEKMACAAKVVRINPSFNEKTALIGLHFIKMKPESEDILSRFIHLAQLEEIRQMNRY